MKIVIKFDEDNSAFESPEERTRVLKKVNEQIINGNYALGSRNNINDINGNSVGFYTVETTITND